jgi:hypothetical protein
VRRLSQDHSPSGVSSAASGHKEISQKRSVRSVNAGSARGGLSPAGAAYDAASETEAELIRMRSPVSTNMLPATEPGSPVSVHKHALRLRHGCHGGLLRHAGVSPRLRRADARRRACELGRKAMTIGRPVRALRRSVGDSMRHAKTGERA